MNIEHLAKTLHEMTELLDDWDDDGGKAVCGVLATRVRNFLDRMNDLAKSWKRELPDPHISPGPKETIDIHWKGKEFELLVNAKDGNGVCTYYGECPEDSHILRGSGCLNNFLAADLLRFILRMPID